MSSVCGKLSFKKCFGGPWAFFNSNIFGTGYLKEQRGHAGRPEMIYIEESIVDMV